VRFLHNAGEVCVHAHERRPVGLGIFVRLQIAVVFEILCNRELLRRTT
jgi:hypothetical protein